MSVVRIRTQHARTCICLLRHIISVSISAAIYLRVESHVESHLSDVEVEELHDQAVEAPVVDVGQAGDEVVLGVTESVHHEPLSLQSSLVVRARLVELQSHGGAVKDRDSTVDHTAPSLANLQQQRS